MVRITRQRILRRRLRELAGLSVLGVLQAVGFGLVCGLLAVFLAERDPPPMKIWNGGVFALAAALAGVASLFTARELIRRWRRPGRDHPWLPGLLGTVVLVAALAVELCVWLPLPADRDKEFEMEPLLWLIPLVIGVLLALLARRLPSPPPAQTPTPPAPPPRTVTRITAPPARAGVRVRVRPKQRNCPACQTPLRAGEARAACHSAVPHYVHRACVAFAHHRCPTCGDRID
jgi:MFS family permease